MDIDYRKQRYLDNPAFALLAFWLTILAIINSIVLLFPITPESRQVILTMEILIGVFLLLDFVYLLRGAPDRRHYFVHGMGWMDLVGSLPFARIIRLFPMIVVGRHLRRSDTIIAREVGLNQRAKSTLIGIVLVAVVIFETAVVLVLQYEAGAPDASIVTGQDALWWAYVTVTTVGYGDMVPVTTGGRFVGIALMTVGIGLFSVITSFMADWFRQARRRRVGIPSKGAGPAANRTEMLSRLQVMIDEQEQQHKEAMAALREQLERLAAMP